MQPLDRRFDRITRVTDAQTNGWTDILRQHRPRCVQHASLVENVTHVFCWSLSPSIKLGHLFKNSLYTLIDHLSSSLDKIHVYDIVHGKLMPGCFKLMQMTSLGRSRKQEDGEAAGFSGIHTHYRAFRSN